MKKITGRYGGLDNMTEYKLASLVRAHSWKLIEGEQEKIREDGSAPCTLKFRVPHPNRHGPARLLALAPISREDLSARELGLKVFKFET